jgi:NarL family two-component system response regulator LiaR
MAAVRRTRVLIVDDHQMVREGLKALLASALDLEVVGEAENGREAVDLVNALSPDVVLMDLVMPVMDGAEATGRILDEAPCVQVVVLTGDGSGRLAEQALERGAISCLLKDVRPEALAQAVRDAAEGKGSVDGVALHAIMERRQACPGGDLTRREREVLELLAEGLTNREIAVVLGLSESTARQHVGSILVKLDVPNRTAAAIRAVEWSLI